MKLYPCVLTIAGSDCSGGAGIQADIKTISALGGYAASVITAVTAQNTCGVTGIHPIPPAFVEKQIEAVMTDIKPKAIKIGMVNDIRIVEAIAQCIRKFQPEHVVFDPVMVSTSGCKLMEDDTIKAITTQLMPLATLITPNLKEAETLLGFPVTHMESMKRAATALLQYGSKAVLVKGGHLSEQEMYDILQLKNEEMPHVYTAPKIESSNTHGTGCTLSSAIATYLTLNYSLPEAVKKAKEYVYQGILHGKDVHVGMGHGPLNHFYAPIPLQTIDK